MTLKVDAIFKEKLTDDLKLKSTEKLSLTTLNSNLNLLFV